MEGDGGRAKYGVQVSGGKGAVVGDYATVFQVFAAAAPAIGSLIRSREFGPLLDDRTRDFVGRDFILGEVEDAVSGARDPSGYVVVQGEPGIGKSALAATLVKRHRWVHHFNVGPSNIRSVEDFLTNVCAQLIVRYELPHDSLPASCGQDAGFLLRLLDEAASERSNHPVVVVVDALDEADDTGLAPANNRLFLPPVLPEGVFFVLTTRPKQDYRLQVDRRRDLYLRDEDPTNLADVRAYVEQFVDANLERMGDRIAAWGVDRGEFAEIVTERSEGNFMYLVHVLADIRDERIAPQNLEDVRALPRGLRDYYQRHWREMKDADPERFGRVHEPVVCMMATVREPVTADAIAEWTELDRGEVIAVVGAWREYFDELPGDPEPRLRIYHASFLDFLSEEVGLAAYHGRIGQQALDKLRR